MKRETVQGRRGVHQTHQTSSLDTRRDLRQKNTWKEKLITNADARDGQARNYNYKDFKSKITENL